MAEFKKAETTTARQEFFRRMYDDSRWFGAIKLAGPQPSFWYGKSFPMAAQQAVRYFIKTEADASEPNNLLSLPSC